MKMGAAARRGLLFAVVAIALSGNQVGKVRAQEKPKAEKQQADAQPKAVAVDAEFLEVLGDYQMIQREIARIENARGTVEIPVSAAELRQRADLKLGKLKAWMTLHKVPMDWEYNASLGSFIPPAGKGEGQAKSEGK